MRKFLELLLGILFVVAPAGQVLFSFGCAAGGSSGTGFVKVSGLVLDSVSTEPVQNLSVNVVDPENNEVLSSTATNAAGEFDISAPKHAILQFETGGAQNTFNLNQLPSEAKAVDILFELENGSIAATEVQVTETEAATPTPTPKPSQASASVSSSSAVSFESSSSSGQNSSAAPGHTPTHSPTPGEKPTLVPTATRTPIPPSPTATPAPFSLGDMNCDGTVNSNDIDPFIDALTNPAKYIAEHPNCDIMLADMNQDGQITPFDLEAFQQALNGG